MRAMRGCLRFAFAGGLVLVLVFLGLVVPVSLGEGNKSPFILSKVAHKVHEVYKGGILGPSRDAKAKAMRKWEFKRAVQYEGTGARIQNFLDKARAGKPFTVSVIGGSVSKGRGLVPAPQESRHHGRQLDLETEGDDLDDGPDGSGDSTTSPESGGTTFTGKLGADTLYSPENMHVLVFDWLNSTFPHPDNKLVNGAQGGVGSGYFSWCFKEHIAVESDLVMVELGINDLIEVDVLGSYEHLIRAVLELPNTPAVINIETFTTLFPTLLSSSALHLDVAAFYDIPSLSIRDVLLPRLLSNPDTEMPRWFRTGPGVKMGDKKVRMWGGKPVDLMHISALGHSLAAGLIIRYLSEEIEKTKSLYSSIAGRLSPAAVRNADLRMMDIPAGALTMPFDADTGLIQYDPTCRSLSSPVYHPDESGQPHRGIPVKPGGSGWSTWSWEEKVYLVASKPGSLISVPFEITDHGPTNHTSSEPDELVHIGPDLSTRVGFEPLPLAVRPSEPDESQNIEVVIEPAARSSPLEGWTNVQKRQYPDVEETGEGARVMIAFLKSATLGLGSVYCWVDEDKSDGTRISGWWDIEERNMGVVEEVAYGIEPGKHTLHCELSDRKWNPKGGTEFRIFGVMHD